MHKHGYLHDHGTFFDDLNYHTQKVILTKYNCTYHGKHKDSSWLNDEKSVSVLICNGYSYDNKSIRKRESEKGRI